jgi:hypothetical protein
MSSILEAIDNTPLGELSRITRSLAGRILLKLDNWMVINGRMMDCTAALLARTAEPRIFDAESSRRHGPVTAS